MTWLDTADPSGALLLRRPEWTAAATLHGALGERLSGDLSLLWVGERDDLDPLTFARTTNDGRLTLDLALALAVWGELEVTARATNLADEDYQDVLGYPAPGRRLLVGLRWGV